MSKILYIDGHNFMWRAKISFGKTDPTVNTEYNIVFNFLRNLRALIEVQNPSQINFVLEGKPTFRYEAYPEYKANRIVKTASAQETRDNFHSNKRKIIELLNYLPIKTIKPTNFECDDCIATLVRKNQGQHQVVISNDSDYIQVLNEVDNLEIYNPFSKKNMERTEYNYLEWKSLAGDKSDNIPGIGDKTAQKMLKNPDKLQKWMSEPNNEESYKRNKFLIEFKQVPEEDLNITNGVLQPDVLKEEFTKLQFNSLLTEKYFTKFIETFNI